MSACLGHRAQISGRSEEKSIFSNIHKECTYLVRKDLVVVHDKRCYHAIPAHGELLDGLQVRLVLVLDPIHDGCHLALRVVCSLLPDRASRQGGLNVI